MEIKVKTDILKDCISYISGGIGTSSIAYKSILIRVEGDTINLYTNSGKIGYRYTIKGEGVDIMEEGDVVLDAQSFLKFVSMSLGDTINISTTDTSCDVVSGRRKLNIAIISVDDFVIFPEAKEEIAKVNTNLFKDNIKSIYTIAEEGDSIKSGVCIKDNALSATDGSCVATLPFKADFSEELVLIKSLCKELHKFSFQGDIILKKSDRHVSVVVEGTSQELVLSSTLLYGSYPEVIKLIEGLELSNHIAIPILDFYNELLYLNGIHEDKLQDLVITAGPDATLSLSSSSDMGITNTTSDMLFSTENSILSKDGFFYRARVDYMLRSIKAFKDYAGSDIGKGDLVYIYYNSTTEPIKMECLGMTQVLAPLS